MLMTRTLFKLLVVTLLLPQFAAAQKNVISLSPTLEKKGAAFLLDSIHLSEFIIDTRVVFSVNYAAGPMSFTTKGDGIFLVNCSPYHLMQWAKRLNGSVYIDEQIKPHTESGVINYNMSINRITTLWNRYPQLTGSGETVSVKENRIDTGDIDLLGRSRPSGFESPVIEPHATTMTTLIAGAGNSSFKGKGVAPSARYSSTDFITVLPDTSTYYLSNGIQVQNHSYGTGIQNFYGINARAFDLSTVKDSTLLHVFSAGNSGSSTSGQGTYANVKGMANITGNMKMAKNVLLAGAVVDDGTIPGLSSKGPLYDGRIAPHLVAFGDDGTSGAAALVSGTALLLQQQYKKLYNQPASAALIRSILVNSAKDLGNEGPDHTSGFGALDADAAVRSLVEKRFIRGSLSSNTSANYDITIPAGMAGFKVSLAWNDEAAASGATQALINDLDMVVVNKQTGERVLPWVLSTFPDADSLRKPARRARDLLNTIEQVSISAPIPGDYTISVVARSLTLPSVSFAISYSYDSSAVFRWDHPLREDDIISENGLRADWTSTFPAGSKGVIEISKDKGASWKLAAANVDLDSGYHLISVADSIAEMMLKMTVNGNTYLTDNFVVSPSMVVKYAYVCDTSVLSYWKGVKGSEGYVLYRLEGNNMKTLKLVADTSAMASKNGSSFFAVAARINGREGARGVATDYTRQNVGCYINNFLASIINTDKASVLLQLGTLYQVKKIVIRKTSSNGRVLLSVDQPQLRNFAVTDDSLTQGLNVYEAIVFLENGTEIRSITETVYYLAGKVHILFPNPSGKGTPLYILSEVVDDEQADMYDMQGRKLKTFTISDKQQAVPSSDLPSGRYFIRVSKAGKIVELLQFIVL